MIGCPAANGSIGGEATYEENFDAWPALSYMIGKVEAVHAGHHNVGEHQVNGTLPLFANSEGLVPIRGVQDLTVDRL